MNRLKEPEIDREEDIRLAPLYEVCGVILLLLAFETLFRHNRCVDSGYSCDELVEVTNHNVAVRHIHLQPFK